MSRFFTQGVALLVLVTFIANSNGQWYDCGTTLSQRLVRFNTFSAYPSPAIPGQQVHLRATYQAYAQLDQTAYVELNILYGPESVLHVTGIPLCNLTSSVSCPVVATPNYTQAISFDWLVPSVADGNYLVNFIIKSPDSGKASAYGCIAFNVSVYNPSATSNGVYASYYQAQLEGDAQFTTSPFLNRDVGSYIQVGPIGPLGAGLSWGTFDYISGSGDVVHQSFDASNYLWGLSGILLNKSTDLTQSSHFYQGQFWIGYSGPYGNYNTQNNTLTGGTFTLTHSQVGPSNYTFNGVLTFLPYGGAFPTGWFNPINLARLGPSVLATNQYGHLIASASTGTCLADPTSATCTGTYNQVTQPPSQDSDPHHLKIILPVVLGFFVLFIVIPLLIFAVIRHRRNRSRISEDRVYNPRPAEYGSALVVDDIMQKSRNHTGAELPILDPSSRQSFPPAYLDDYPAPVIAPPRTVRRTPQEPRRDDRRRSPRQDRRPAPRRPAYSDTDSEPQLRGRGANRSRSPSPRGRDASLSRSRSRSRSRSLSRSRSISRSRSPSRSDRGSRSRSVSRSMSRSRSPVSGSSVSRSSFSEGPRR